MSESFLTREAAMQKAGFSSKSSFYAAIRAGRMPKPCKRGRSSVWLASELQSAINAEAVEMKAARDGEGRRSA